MVKRISKKKASVFGHVMKIVALVGVIGILAAAVLLMLLIDTNTWKDFDPDRLTNVKQTLYVYDKEDEPVAGIYNFENRTKISIDQVPEHVKNAFIATEDARFYKHKGFDIVRFFGALWKNIKSRSFSEGFSTISQQLIKNSHLTTEKTINRKVQEIYLALKLEQEYSKDQILEMYLNFVYFGNGAYGIEAAAQSYFGKPASELTIAEGALLAGIVKRPGHYAPHINLEASTERRNLILSLMEKYELITGEQREKAKAEKVNLKLSRPENDQYNQYVDAVLNEAADKLNTSYEDITSSGYKIYTALDVDLQSRCQELFQNSELFPEVASDGSAVEGAAVVMNSQDGSVIAMIGGREYVNRGLNRATSAYRQPGSTIKPIVVYGPAIDRFGYNGATLLNDAPIDINGYSPKNYGGGYKGWMSMRYAVAKSVNIPAVLTFNDIGVENGKSYAETVGIQFDETDDSLALALGGFKYGVTPMQLAASYQPFTNGGRYNQPHLIRRIEDSYGKVIYEHQPNSYAVLSPSSAFIMADILKSAVSWGTCKRAAVDGVPMGGKTGTVSYKNGVGVNDAWIATFTTEHVVTVWNGYDRSDDVHHMPSSATGGRFPAMMAHEIMAEIYKDHVPNDLVKPDDVKKVALDKLSYEEMHLIQLASEYTPDEYIYYEYFTQHSIPGSRSTYWDKPLAVTDLAVTLNEANQPVITFTAPQPHIKYSILRRSQEGMEPLLLTTLSGENPNAEFVDTTATEGTYEYAVQPYHPLVLVEGEYLMGPMTPYVSVTLVPPEPTKNPWWPFPWKPKPDRPGKTEEPEITPTPTPTPEPTPTPTPEA